MEHPLKVVWPKVLFAGLAQGRPCTLHTFPRTAACQWVCKYRHCRLVQLPPVPYKHREKIRRRRSHPLRYSLQQGSCMLHKRSHRDLRQPILCHCLVNYCCFRRNRSAIPRASPTRPLGLHETHSCTNTGVIVDDLCAQLSLLVREVVCKTMGHFGHIGWHILSPMIGCLPRAIAADDDALLWRSSRPGRAWLWLEALLLTGHGGLAKLLCTNRYQR